MMDESQSNRGTQGIMFPTDYYVYLKKGYSSAGNDRKGLDGFYGKYIFTVRGIYMGERLDMLPTTEAVKYGFSTSNES